MSLYFNRFLFISPQFQHINRETIFLPKSCLHMLFYLIYPLNPIKHEVFSILATENSLSSALLIFSKQLPWVCSTSSLNFSFHQVISYFSNMLISALPFDWKAHTYIHKYRFAYQGCAVSNSSPSNLLNSYATFLLKCYVLHKYFPNNSCQIYLPCSSDANN